MLGILTKLMRKKINLTTVQQVHCQYSSKLICGEIKQYYFDVTEVLERLISAICSIALSEKIAKCVPSDMQS